MPEQDFGLECHCDYCNHEENILVYEKDYDAWHNGEPIQDVMDYLTSDEREIINTNTCGSCWDKFFPNP
jgi:hypothetical protein